MMIKPGERCEASQQLKNAWDEVTTVLSRFTYILRSFRGCENVVVTICIRNGSRVDAFSIPDETVNNGEKQKLDNATSTSGVEGEGIYGMSSDQQIDCGVDFEKLPPPLRDENVFGSYSLPKLTEYLQGLSNQQVRSFLTDVRRRLKLKNFDWPHAAKVRFESETSAPIPTAPGRANSGKESLLHMLRLSAETNEAWRDSFCKAYDSLLNRVVPVLDKRAEESAEELGGCTNEEDTNDSNLGSPQSELEASSEPSYESEPHMPDHIMSIARNLPVDDLKVLIPIHSWVSLPSLLSNITHPWTQNNIDWFIHQIPGDGNCMFSAILVAARLRNCLCSSLDSVLKMRRRLRTELIDLSKAGRSCSKYRRDWLASCLYEIDNRELRNFCQNQLQKARSSHRDTDMESLLAPLRIIMSNWADMVGCDHWGGLQRIELSIIATMLGAVIEVMEPAGDSHPVTSAAAMTITVCDTRGDKRLTKLKRRDLIHPHYVSLPSVNEGYIVPMSHADSSTGWVGRYPLLRIVLENRHYSACTSRYDYPICPQEGHTQRNPSNPHFNESSTLVVPFSSLSGEERDYHKRAVEMIQHWREACGISPESGSHVDTIVMESRCTTLTVSMLSHLEEPSSITVSDQRYWVSDEIVTCYMYLLQGRTDEMRRRFSRVQRLQGTQEPPRSIYMDSWFFKSLSRGLSGPSWKKKRIDLREFNTILIPALVDGHWALAVCYVDDGIIGVYDPLNVSRYDIFRIIHNWVQVQLPGGDKRSWRFEDIREVRGCTQVGSVDCGIYICKAAESLGLGFPIRISQADICYVRKRMIVEFMKQEATSFQFVYE